MRRARAHATCAHARVSVARDASPAALTAHWRVPLRWQAEHDPSAIPSLVCTSEAFAAAVEAGAVGKELNDELHMRGLQAAGCSTSAPTYLSGLPNGLCEPPSTNSIKGSDDGIPSSMLERDMYVCVIGQVSRVGPADATACCGGAGQGRPRSLRLAVLLPHPAFPADDGVKIAHTLLD